MEQADWQDVASSALLPPACALASALGEGLLEKSYQERVWRGRSGQRKEGAFPVGCCG